MRSTHENLPGGTVAPAGPTGIDPFELPDTIQLGGVADPYPQLAAARRRAPVLREWPLTDQLLAVDAAAGHDDSGQAVNVLGFDEVVSVLRDHETFSSTIVDEVMGPVIGPAIVAMDEPEHRARRALVARAFGPKLLARWEHDLVRRVLDELIDGFVADGRADLVRRLTFAFPVRVIARILGLSPWTVKNHVQNLLHKLGVQNRAHAVSRATRLRS